jgi:hypothetical protein
MFCSWERPPPPERALAAAHFDRRAPVERPTLSALRDTR